MSRVHNIETWAKRIHRLSPISFCAVETVRFDMQKMQDPEMSGVEYQQGELLGYEVREYLLEKWGRKCAYCGKENVPIEVEHIQPKSKGGTNRISNLTLACRECNEKKRDQNIREFLKKKTWGTRTHSQ
jgi:5-methylcytosine-specific restriction endonuclease McrA